jgi:hypothetical protein
LTLWSVCVLLPSRPEGWVVGYRHPASPIPGQERNKRPPGFGQGIRMGQGRGQWPLRPMGGTEVRGPQAGTPLALCSAFPFAASRKCLCASDNVGETLLPCSSGASGSRQVATAETSALAPRKCEAPRGMVAAARFCPWLPALRSPAGPGEEPGELPIRPVFARAPVQAAHRSSVHATVSPYPFARPGTRQTARRQIRCTKQSKCSMSCVLAPTSRRRDT